MASPAEVSPAGLRLGLSARFMAGFPSLKVGDTGHQVAAPNPAADHNRARDGRSPHRLSRPSPPGTAGSPQGHGTRENLGSAGPSSVPVLVVPSRMRAAAARMPVVPVAVAAWSRRRVP